MLDITRVVISIIIMILFKKVRLFGVFLSPRAFLKSLMTLLNCMLPLVYEDMEEADGCPLMNASLPSSPGFCRDI